MCVCVFCCLRGANVQAETGNMLTFCFLGCPELNTSDLKCIVYNENTHIYDTVYLGKRTEEGYKTF